MGAPKWLAHWEESIAAEAVAHGGADQQCSRANEEGARGDEVRDGYFYC